MIKSFVAKSNKLDTQRLIYGQIKEVNPNRLVRFPPICLTALATVAPFAKATSTAGISIAIYYRVQSTPRRGLHS